MSHHHSRREFLGLTALGAAGAIAPPWLHDHDAWVAQSGTSGPEADLVVFNARVYTMDAAMPRAEAFALKDGRFVAVGTSGDIRGLAGKEPSQSTRSR